MKPFRGKRMSQMYLRVYGLAFVRVGVLCFRVKPLQGSCSFDDSRFHAFVSRISFEVDVKLGNVTFAMAIVSSWPIPLCG